jgi:hypothetical protein
MDEASFIIVWVAKGHFKRQFRSLMTSKVLCTSEYANYVDYIEWTGVADILVVWRIKKAESPLQDRLRQRGLIKKFYHSMWEKRIEDLQNAQNNRGQ